MSDNHDLSFSTLLLFIIRTQRLLSITEPAGFRSSVFSKLSLKNEKGNSANNNDKTKVSSDLSSESTQEDLNNPSASEQPAREVENSNSGSGRSDGEIVEEDPLPGVLSALQHAVGENADQARDEKEGDDDDEEGTIDDMANLGCSVAIGVPEFGTAFPTHDAFLWRGHQ